MKKWQGSKWIRKTTRMAIYLRDGFACAYCGVSAKNGVMLTLDHLIPTSQGGNNSPTNLVCACETCNKSRQDLSVRDFCKKIASRLNREWNSIEDYVFECSKKELNRVKARRLVKMKKTGIALADLIKETVAG